MLGSAYSTSDAVQDIAMKDTNNNTNNTPATPTVATNSSSDADIPFILCPLLNLCNTCYFNAGVQLLANCPPFVYGLRNSPFRQPRYRRRALTLPHKTAGNNSQELLQSFAQLLHDMEFAPLRAGQALSPLRALESLAKVHPAFEGRGQQDCPEMVHVIIANMSEEGGMEVDLEPLLHSFDVDMNIYNNINNTSNGMTGTSNTTQGSKSLQVMHNGESDPVKIEEAISPGQHIIGGYHHQQQHHHQHQQGIMHHEENRKIGDRIDEFSVKSSLHGSILSNIHPGSWWDFNILRLMRKVNAENELLERKEKSRKKEPYQNSFRPPKLFYNSVTDSFTGYMMSEVQCHSCGAISRIIEGFSSLTIDIPSDSQRLRYAKEHPEVQRLAADGSSLHQKRSGEFQWWNPLMWITAATRRLFNIITGFSNSVNYPVTLQECLDIHFEPVILKGSNEYHCASCNSSSEATKRETLLSVPEYLLLQMKRFEYGHCFNTKKTDPVIFPVSWDTGIATSSEVLRFDDYMHESVITPEPIPPCKENGSPINSSSHRNLDINNGTSKNKSNTSPSFPTYVNEDNVSLRSEKVEEGNFPVSLQSPILTYTLEAVVNHHGSIGGGHYTAYTRKCVGQRDVWVYLSDEDILAAELSDVADSEEYLLMYRKQSLQPRSEIFYTLRNKARKLLANPPLEDYHALDNDTLGMKVGLNGNNNNNNNNNEIVYISRPWLQRMAFMEEPGPILNRLCYCSEETIRYEAERKKLQEKRQQHEEENENKNEEREEELEELKELKKTKEKLEENLFSYNGCLHHDIHGPPVEWFYVPIKREEYNSFYQMYGGNGPITQENYEKLHSMQQQQNEAAY